MTLLTTLTITVAMALGPGDDPDVIAAYEAARASASTDADGHLSLARFCRKAGLDDRQRVHLLAAAAAAGDADRAAQLRRKAGDTRIDGEWMDPTAARMLDRIDEERRDVARRRWRELRDGFALAAAGKDREALAKLARIDGPQASWLIGAAALSPGLTYDVQELAVASISTRRGVAAAQALAELAVHSDWPGVRRRAIEGLDGRRLSDFVPLWLRRMHTDPVVRTTFSGGRVGNVATLSVESETHHLRKRLVTHAVTHYRSAGIVAVDPTTRPGLSAGSLLSQFAEQTAFYSGRQGQDAVARRASAIEADIRRLNRRSLDALHDVTGEGPFSEPQDAWNFWASHHGLASIAGSDEKELVEVSETQRQVVRIPERVVFRVEHECFAAGTPVWTPDGPRPIETFQTGDEVLTYDVEAGRVVTGIVLEPTRRFAREHFRLRIPGETLVTTGGHPIWENGYGWRRVRHARPGVQLATMSGDVSLTGASIIAGDEASASAPVYNLVVDRRHSYFVGDHRILVHDDTVPRPTDVETLTPRRVAAR